MPKQFSPAIVLADRVAYSPMAVCKLFSPPLPKAHVYDAIRLGELRSFSIGVRSYVTRDQVLAWIAEKEGIQICR
jgi:hypothetical protein